MSALRDPTQSFPIYRGFVVRKRLDTLFSTHVDHAHLALVLTPLLGANFSGLLFLRPIA
jgi:hypothetical protein